MIDLLLHWRIQRNGLCICDLDDYQDEDANVVRRWCVDDVACSREDHAVHGHQEPWEENKAAAVALEVL